MVILEIWILFCLKEDRDIGIDVEKCFILMFKCMIAIKIIYLNYRHACLDNIQTLSYIKWILIILRH